MKLIKNISILSLALISFVLFANAQEDIPDPPKFLSASVTPGISPGEVVLKWLPSDSADVKGYIIYEVVGNTSVTIDTVYGRNSTEYVNHNSLAEVQTETYRLASFDTLLFKSMITDPHTTMLISSGYEQCAQSINITWTEYIGFPNGVKSYKIFRKQNSSDYSAIASVASDTLSFTDIDLEPGNSYCYYVAAIDENNNMATSGQTCQYLEGFIAPRYLKAKSAVVEANAIVLEFFVDKDAEVKEYKLMRSESKNGRYKEIETQPKLEQNIIEFVDFDVEVNEQIFYYKIAAYDLCGRLFFHSNPICNIIVTVPENSELTHTIEWTPAEFLYGVENYRLMAVYGDDSANEIGYYQLEDLRVTYDIESYVRLRHARKEYVTNNYCYYIEAYENNEKIDNLSPAYAKSNIACTSHQPVVWIPNAFAPGSFVDKNKYFRPIVSFVDEYSYKMTIFDKNGLEVFSTSETTGVWDGKIKGTRAPAGIYVYRIAYSNSAGNDFEHTGILNLVY